jgi:hypothetical protein
MDDLFIIFVALAALAGWASGYWWNKHEAASQCAALERELKDAHALDLRTLTAALAQTTGELRIALNRLQAIDEARTQKEAA